ncbi:hypothetical protein L9G15_17485 [Shewanella sp. A3A]|nr:hypothetical protein [Shewanella ferrihydritica]
MPIKIKVLLYQGADNTAFFSAAVFAKLNRLAISLEGPLQYRPFSCCCIDECSAAFAARSALSSLFPLASSVGFPLKARSGGRLGGQKKEAV